MRSLRAASIARALAVACIALAAESPILAQAADPDLLLRLATLHAIPGPGPVAILPRIFAAYGALIAAAMLGLLYLYRRRAFIVYWIGSWLMVAAALGLVARVYDDSLISSIVSGVAMLLLFGSAGLVLLGARAFPQNSIEARPTLKWVALAAVWFLGAPFVAPRPLVIGAGVIAVAVLLGWSGVRYLVIGRRSRYASAMLVGAGLTVVGIANLGGVAVTLALGAVADTALSSLAAVNVITSLFVALGMHLLVVEDMIEELRRTNRDLGAAHDEVKRLAITDPLTACHNRRFFDEIERREIQRHRRYSSPMSVMFVDVNHFKRLNDSLGHDHGDEVLRTIGLMLRRQVRESDYVIRWGGDEFLLMLTCSEAEAQAKAEDLKIAFTRERAASSLPDYLGLSIGVASVPRSAETLRDAIRYADSRMYRDKLAVRGQTQAVL